jgi:hypothetical protein
MKLIELIDFNHHQNEIALFKSLIGEDYFYEKHSFSNSAELLIKNEFEGYKWFYKKMNKFNDVRSFENKLLIPEYVGKKIPSLSTISGNEIYIEKILNLYMKLWNSKNNFAIHGDFAFGNFIFSEDEVHIIDWEHFHESPVENYGYDFIHFIFLCLKKDSFKLSNRTKSFLRSCLKSLRDSVNHKNIILDKPFQNSNKYINENLNCFFKNKIASKKFEFSYTNLNILIELDNNLT